MAIGRISGPMLYSNLDRQGANLTVDSDLLHFDVVNRRVGVNNNIPSRDLDVPGNVRLANLSILDNSIVSNTGKINLGSTSNVIISGGTNYDVMYTDGNGNLTFTSLNNLSSISGELTGNTITLGTNTLGVLNSNAVTLASGSSVTNSIAQINQVLGLITNSDGTIIDVDDVYGVLKTNTQPYINTVGTLTDLSIGGDLTVSGNTYLSGYTNLTILDSIINLHTQSDISDWTSNDGRDIGVAFQYYDTSAGTAFLGRDNATGYLEWIDRGIEGAGNIFQANTFGTIKSGEFLAVNTTPSTSTTTGALRVAGGAGIQGNLNAGNVSATTGIFTTINGNLPAPYVQGTVVTANVSLYLNVAESDVNSTFYLPFVDKITGNVAEFTDSSLTYNPNTHYLTAGRFIGDGYFSTAHASSFSTGNAVIDGGYLTNISNITATTTNFSTTTSNTLNATNGNITTISAPNFSSGNAQITGGAITDTPISGSTGYFTTQQSDNFSSANIVITGGYINGLANISAGVGNISTLNSESAVVTNINSTAGNITTLFTDNFSTGNAQITGGQISGLLSIGVETINASSITAANVNSSNGNVTVLVAGNLSTSNAQITGGAITATPVSGSTGHFTTLQGTDFSSGNVRISGGYIGSLTNATITTTNTTTLNADYATIATLNSTSGNVTTLDAVNFSSGNVRISGGYISDLANITTTAANFTTSTATNLNATNGNIVTLYSDNFSSSNVQITGGTILSSVIIGTANTANVSLYSNVLSSSADSTFYPAFYNTTTGNAAAYTSNLMTYVPAVGNLITNNFVGNVHGKVLTSDQEYITSLGDLISLNVVGNISAGNISSSQFSGSFDGEVITPAQPYITSLGNLVSLTVTGNIGAASVNSQFYGNLYTNYVTSLTSNVVIDPNGGFVLASGTTGLVVPVGTTANRPDGVPGAIRYNTTLATIEYYNGAEWVPVTNIIESQVITGNGINSTYTLDYASNEDGILVSINGTLQQPTISYTVAGDQITFAEPPLTTDVITVRFIASLSSPLDNENFETINVGTLSLDQVEQKFSAISSASGTVVHDCQAGLIFNHTALSGNFTANFTNLAVSVGYSTTIKLILDQGVTPYVANVIQISGVTQTVKWQDGSSPIGSANKTDVQTLEILNIGGSYLVLGSISSFG
jgi:fibronectin-binding autotransporter adhesin